MSLRNHWNWMSRWVTRWGLHEKTSNQEAEHVGPFMLPGLDMGSPWLLTEGVSWVGSRPKTHSVQSVETLKGLSSSQGRESLAPSRAAPESRHTVGTGHMHGPTTNTAAGAVGQVGIPFLPPPLSRHGEQPSPPQSCERRRQQPCLCCCLE